MGKAYWDSDVSFNRRGVYVVLAGNRARLCVREEMRGRNDGVGDTG